MFWLIHYMLRFKFKASNNELEYEALISGLKLAEELKAEAVHIFNNLQLLVCQINEEYQAQGVRMVAYRAKAKELLPNFKSSLVEHISRARNVNGDALAKLASTKDIELLNVISMNFYQSQA